MPFNGSGQFNLAVTFTPGTTAAAEDVEAAFQDIATGLSDCLTRDGQAPATGNISLGGNKLQEVGNGTLPSDGANLNILPPGTLLPWLVAVVPTGFILAAGQLLDQSSYPGIFSVFGTSFNTGGETSTQFRMPDLRGRVFAGLDNMGGTAANILTGFGNSGTQIGAAGGEQSHTLTAAELAAHSHPITDPGHTHGITDPGHTHPYRRGIIDNAGQSGPSSVADVLGNDTTGSSTTGLTVNSATTGITVNNNTSGGGSHNNVQPTFLGNWIVKT